MKMKIILNVYAVIMSTRDWTCHVDAELSTDKVHHFSLVVEFVHIVQLRSSMPYNYILHLFFCT